MIDYPDNLDDSSSSVEWADWLELSLIFGDGGVSRSDFGEMLELRGLTLDEQEELIDGAFLEISRREALLGDLYPCSNEGPRVALKTAWTDWLAFSFLVALGTRHMFDTTAAKGQTTEGAGPLNTGEYARLFEHLVTDGLAAYLGGQAIRIAAPREPPVPTSFPECLQYLCTEMSEEAREPENPNARDEHVDIVGWRPFLDRRGGQVIVLAQCKTGRKWRSETDHIELDVWTNQVKWDEGPVKAFAFPFVFDGDDWHYQSHKHGILFDRLRLSSLVADARLEQAIQERLKTWCESFREALPSVQ